MSLLKSILAAALLGTGVSAQADTKILEVREWALWESDSNVCYLQTIDKAIFRAEDYFIEIAKLKNKPDSPVEVLARIQKNKKGTTGLLIPVGSGSMALSDVTGNKERFWGVSKNLSVFIEALRKEDEIPDIQAIGGSKTDSFKITGRGFSEVLTEMEKRCNGGQRLVNKEFEANFLGAVGKVDPTKIGSSKTIQLRSIYFSAYGTFLQLKEAHSALNRILAKYQPLIDELKMNRASLAQIQNIDLPQSQQTLAAAQKQQVDAKTEISRIEALLPGLAAKVQVSQKAFDDAKAILAPHVSEYNRITGNLSSAQSSLSEAQSRLSEIDSRLQNISSQIRSLDSEADNIERDLPQRRMELDRARSYLRDAERRRADFNISFEIDRRLRDNFDYNRARDERNQLVGVLNQVERELQEIRGERERIRRLLEQCQAEPAPTPKPKPGDREMPPEEVRADCSRLQEALQVANNQVSEKERAQRDLQSRKSDLENRMSDIERQIDHDVRREYDNLVKREQEARQQVSNLEDIVRNNENRLSQIRSSEIPRLEREQSQLSNERPSVLARISQSANDIDRLKRELSSFKTATDWDRKSAAVEATGRQLRVDQNALASAQQQKSNALASLQNGIATEAQMKSRIDSLKAKVISLNERAVVLEEGIKPLAAERAPIDALIAQLGSVFSGKQTEFLNLLK